MKINAALWGVAGLLAAVGLSACGSAPVPDAVVKYSSTPIECRNDGECQQDWARVQQWALRTNQEVRINQPALIETRGDIPAANSDDPNPSPKHWTFSREPMANGVTERIWVRGACGTTELCQEAAPDIARVKHFLITGQGF
jgi:hypothetical protein